MFDSNAIKFTHKGKVGIKLYVVPEPRNLSKQKSLKVSADQSAGSTNTRKDSGEVVCDNNEVKNLLNDPQRDGTPMEEDKTDPHEQVVWIRCDVHDTGIGIPGICSNSRFSMNSTFVTFFQLHLIFFAEHAKPTLFKKYTQAGTDTARKYGGTGLGLAICKQLVSYHRIACFINAANS